MKVPYALWYGTQPELSTLMAFGTNFYAFKYRSSSVPGKRFILGTIFGYFVGTDSENTILRVYHPSENQVRPCR